MKGIVTINTDAGYYPHDKVGAYAYWIKGDGLSLKGSGLFKDKINSALDAEMKAIINALHVLKKSKYKAEFIVINRDNIYAKSGKQTELQIKMASLIKSIKKHSIPKSHRNYQGTYVDFRNVKGHLHTKTARHWVNDWCDKQCTMHLKKWKADQLQK